MEATDTKLGEPTIKCDTDYCEHNRAHVEYRVCKYEFTIIHDRKCTRFEVKGQDYES